MAETGLGEGRDSIVIVGHAESLSADLLVQSEEAQVRCNRGSGNAREPGEFCLGVSLAGVQQPLILKGLLDRVGVSI